MSNSAIEDHSLGIARSLEFHKDLKDAIEKVQSCLSQFPIPGFEVCSAKFSGKIRLDRLSVSKIDRIRYSMYTYTYR